MVTGLVVGSSSVITLVGTTRSVPLENIACAVVAALVEIFSIPVEAILLFFIPDVTAVGAEWEVVTNLCVVSAAVVICSVFKAILVMAEVVSGGAVLISVVNDILEIIPRSFEL